MKTSPVRALAASILAICALVSNQAMAQDPPIPVGRLDASPGIVMSGTKPTLNWEITYPSVVKDIVTIEPPATVVPKVKVNMDVRVVGASVKVVWLNVWGIVTKWEWAPTEAAVKIDSGDFSQIFYNTQANVNPSKVVYNKKLNAKQKVNFSGRYNFNGWSTRFTSNSSSQNVVALVNGDVPPTTTPLYQQPTINDFIKPYLDSQGRIKIGPKDVIYLMELTHTDKRDGGFDLQDLALLVTFQPTE